MNINLLRVLVENKYVNRFKKSYPRITHFIERRISRTSPKGLWFTVGLMLSAISFFCFLALVQDILTHDPFVQADVRIINLIADFSDLSAAKFFLLVTYLGSWPIVMSLGVVVFIILFLLIERRQALFFVSSVAITAGIYSILKLIIHRPRPDIGYSLISRNGFSFPSGHATMSIVFYGLLGYLIYRICKKWWQKLLIVTTTLVIVYFIGFSRMYLGVHWPSDILAGWAVGLSILIFAITLFVEQERFASSNKKNSFLPKKKIAAIAITLLLLEGLFIGYYYKAHPLRPTLEPRSSIPQEEKITLSSLDDLFRDVSLSRLPKFSETITGNKMGSVSLIVVASSDDLNKTFAKAGWFVAERGIIGRIPKLVFTAIFDQPYPTAPVTPSFLNAWPENIAFQKPTDLNTMRQRHHTRFWLTDYSVNGTSVWVATASFDDGMRYLIAHDIRPDIDTERDFIKDEFINTGLVKTVQEIQLVPPFAGTNQGGDKFFTDGKAYVIVLNQ